MMSADDKALTLARVDVAELLPRVAAETARERVSTVQRIPVARGSA